MNSAARPARPQESDSPSWRGTLSRLSDRMSRFRTPWVGEVLLKEAVITQAQLDKALARQEEIAQPIGQTVVEMGLADEGQVLDAINKHYRIAASALSENIAALIRSRAESRRSMSRVRRVLRTRLSLILVATIWVTILALSLVTLGRHRAQLTESTLELGAVSLNYLAENAKVPLLDGNVLQLNRFVKAITQSEDVRYSLITDSKGVVRAHSDPKMIGSRMTADPTRDGTQRNDGVAIATVTGTDGRESLHLAKPVSFRSKTLGRAHVVLSLDRISYQMRQETILIGALSLLIVAFGIVLAIQQGGRLLRPFTTLLAAAPAGESEHEFRVRVRSSHAFEDLATSFDEISRDLSQKLMVEQSFGRYVNPDVLDLIRANPEETWLKGSRSEATVLFTDVRGFTGMAEEREPEAVVEALNEYFAVATRAIIAEGGYVDKYIGDGVLGVFGVPTPYEDHALRAVKAAVCMQKELRRRARNNLNPFLLKVGIGVNSGAVVAGSIGSEDKMEYTVIGDCVNVASRLNGLAEPGEVIVSGTVADQIPRHLMTVRELDATPLKGKKEFVPAFKVLKTEF